MDEDETKQKIYLAIINKELLKFLWKINNKQIDKFEL